MSASMKGDALPPHDPNAEASVLASCLISISALEKVSEILQPEMFYLRSHQLLYGLFLNLAASNVPVDLVTVDSHLKAGGLSEATGGLRYLTLILDQVPTARNAFHYAEIVQRHWLARQVREIGYRAFTSANDLEEEPKQLIERFSSELFSLGNTALRSDFSSALELLPNFYEEVTMDPAEADPRGVPIGLKDLGTLLGTWNRQDLILVGAETSRGKCLAGDSLVVDPDTGERLRLDQFCAEKRPRILGVDDQGRLRPATVANWIDNGVKPTFRLRTRLGKEIIATDNHPFLTVLGWSSLSDLKTGDCIAVPRQVPAFGGCAESEYRARLLGYFMADGGLTNLTPSYTKGDAVIVADFRDCLAKSFPGCEMRKNGPLGWRVTRGGKREGPLVKNPVTAWLKDLGLMGKPSRHKSFPDVVWTWDKKALSNFLRALISSDGSFYDNGHGGYPAIEFTVASRTLAMDVQHALTRLGIIASLNYKLSQCNGKHFDAWRIVMSGSEYIGVFESEIGWVGRKASLTFPTREKTRRCMGNAPAVVWRHIKQLLSDQGMSLSELTRRIGSSHRHSTSRPIALPRLAAYAKVLQDPTLTRASSPDLFWDTVVEIESMGLQQVYDLTVPDGSSFIAQDICVHNSALCITETLTAIRKGYLVAMASVEMSKDDVVARLVSQASGIPLRKIRDRDFDGDKDLDKLADATGELASLPFHLDDSRDMSILDLRAKLRRLVARGGRKIDLLVVDYINNLKPIRDTDLRPKQLGDLARALRDIAQEFDCPVLCAAQLHRIQKGETPHRRNFRDSGEQEEVADLCVLLHREEKASGIRYWCIVDKNRQGPPGKVELAWRAETAQFADLAYRY